jgi:hypothetical protein
MNHPPAVLLVQAPQILGIAVEFWLFGATLLAVALLHRHSLAVALTGLAAIVLYTLLSTGYESGPGFAGLAGHLAGEWVTLANLFLLLLGFTLLSRHFEESKVPAVLPRLLPDDWKGAFVLLVIVFALSSFLDNIAAALIGGAMAHTLFRGRVHIGYLAAIVAASNAGGSGSVVGDTTTTMMWIEGVEPQEVLHAYVAAGVALLVCGIPAALQQQRYSPIVKHAPAGVRVDWVRVGIVAAMLVVAIVTNVYVNLAHPGLALRFPFIGVALWVVLLASVPFRRPDWQALPESVRGTVFLLSLVTCASLMPVEQLPAASWETTLALGVASAVFDNIPLTALALEQGGYDWGFLAYAVGFGGSMLWFGSSAGVALTNLFPEGRDAGAWLRHGWHVALAYAAGFLALLLVVGWAPHPPHH